MPSSELAFRKQFLVSSSFSITVNEGWTSEPLWRGYRLLRCPDLHYARHSEGQKDVIVLGVSVLDLLYWEHRGGVWASGGWTLKEGLYESLAPMNNRALLEAGLTVPLELRSRPHQLFLDLIDRLDPSLLKWPFNTTRVEQLSRRCPVPRRLKSWLQAT